jgi:hypothetical protein
VGRMSRLAAGLTVLLAVCFATATASAREPAVVANTATRAANTAQEAAAFWTPARMREAIRNSSEPRSSTVAQTARAAGARPAPAHLPGMKAIGRIFSVRPDGQPRSCTGTLIDSPNRSLVWTAGHCVHTGRGGAFHTNFVFAPGFQPQLTGNPAPFGIWPAATWAAAGSWVAKGIPLETDRKGWKTAQYDMAGLVLGRDPAGRTAGDAVGGTHNIRFRVRKSRAVRMIGYPVAPPYLGENLMQCGPSRTRARRFAPNLRMIPCPLTLGMSGGPALIRVDAGGFGTVIGEMTVTDFSHMFIPFQGREARRLYRLLARSPS